MVTVFLAEGFEEIEAVTPIDVLRRGGVPVRTCSITDSRLVTGAHNILFYADTTLEELSDSEEVILLPGGMPGTLNLKNCEKLKERILTHNENGKILAAICAAPTILGAFGLLKEKEATCFPGMEEELFAGKHLHEKVVVSGNVVTSRGAGTASDFAFTLLSLLKGDEIAKELSETMCYGEGRR